MHLWHALAVLQHHPPAHVCGQCMHPGKSSGLALVSPALSMCVTVHSSTSGYSLVSPGAFKGLLTLRHTRLFFWMQVRTPCH